MNQEYVRAPDLVKVMNIALLIGDFIGPRKHQDNANIGEMYESLQGFLQRNPQEFYAV